VILTVIDVGGAMYYWGMSIDTISVIANVVAIGLCVDYAAHIGKYLLKFFVDAEILRLIITSLHVLKC